MTDQDDEGVESLRKDFQVTFIGGSMEREFSSSKANLTIRQNLGNFFTVIQTRSFSSGFSVQIGQDSVEPKSGIKL